MANYQKMYALLCCAIDGVLGPLQEIPAAKPYAATLQAALLNAEELYICTSDGGDPQGDHPLRRFK